MKNKLKETRLLFVSLPVENQAITDLANTVINDPSVKLDAPDFAAFTPQDIFIVKSIAEMLYDNLSINPKATVLAGLDAAISFNGNKASKKQIEGMANLAMLCDRAFENYISKFRLDVDSATHDIIAATSVKMAKVEQYKPAQNLEQLISIYFDYSKQLSEIYQKHADRIRESMHAGPTVHESPEFTDDEVAQLSPAGKKYFGGMKSPRPSKSKR